MGRGSHSNWYYLRKCQAALILVWPSAYQPPLVNRDPLHSLSYWQACFTSPLSLLVPRQQTLLLLVYLCFLHDDSLQDIVTRPQRWLFVTLIQSATNAKKPECLLDMSALMYMTTVDHTWTWEIIFCPSPMDYLNNSACSTYHCLVIRPALPCLSL